ncbi:hypothetical protein ACNDUG_000858 [Escherichia coli]
MATVGDNLKANNTTSFLPGGAPKNKTFTLELKYYGEKLADY